MGGLMAMSYIKKKNVKKTDNYLKESNGNSVIEIYNN